MYLSSNRAPHERHETDSGPVITPGNRDHSRYPLHRPVGAKDSGRGTDRELLAHPGDGHRSSWWNSGTDNEPDAQDPAKYRDKLRDTQAEHELPEAQDIVFVEVTVTDPSGFETRLDVHGRVMHQQYRVLTMESSSVPNALAALVLRARDETGAIPHLYFGWTEGNPVSNFLRFLLFDVGEIAPVTREVLRRAEHNRSRSRRPHIHVG